MARGSIHPDDLLVLVCLETERGLILNVVRYNNTPTIVIGNQILVIIYPVRIFLRDFERQQVVRLV